MNKKAIYAMVGLAVVVGGWALFRPEKLFINQAVNEALPGATAQASLATPATVTLASGMFRSLAHESKGQATVYQLADGKRILRLTDFATSNGPALHLYMVAAADAPDNDTVKKAGFVDLGDLKGNVGDQNYELPADLDLNKYKAVTVWCQRFAVNFTTAPLVMNNTTMAGGPTALAAGRFQGIAHESKGQATIYQLADGKRVLRLTDFQTSNGPALHLYMVAAANVPDNDTVKKAGFVDLGDLKGNVGDQNYELPADLDLNKYKSVTVWCQRFSVNFATASLTAQK